ncbi:MAG: orc1/cdc6 family replication initiation protein [Candidatus Bathyarchaeota archaeon]|nr:orc1/cdc6 family replication initiation protein [Candidatus Bathyarchaeota archaeon]MDD4324894.1 orc1/cdc6 family replication initiation protein [Candidatus Bathyarchaeota archaeon]MDI9578497.1 orc1/cdc6 family replication initiation protein [Thermoproteota archaeon]MDT8781785.1 orc1/cdc6 family replication initiation protein [Candidatus Bathyarchaeota archaeon]NLD65309.1 AAA family ATPase [Thermoproteota archaeon]
MVNSSILDDVFDSFVNGVKLFKDREVLRHDYLPEKLPHREDQIRLLGSTVAPVLKDARCSNIFIYGKTGTGKTAVTKYVLSHLESKAKEYGAKVKFCYINCRMTGSEYRVFASLSQSIGLAIPFTGLSVGEVFDRFRLGLDQSHIIFIIILDEVDALIKDRGDSFMYELTRINETLTKSKVSIIGISNDLRLKEFLDPRVFSSLSEEELVFRPYDAAELRNILFERSKLAFQNGVLSESALSISSALAAAEHGDARRALDLLRVAGEVAERQNAQTVTEEHVRQAEKHIEHNRVIETLKNLTLHSKLVLLSVYHLNKSSATTGEIYDIYNELCGEMGLGLLTQRRLGTLINELDSMGLVNAKVVSMGRYGRTKKIRLEISRSIIKDIFSGDNRFNQLLNYTLRTSHKK